VVSLGLGSGVMRLKPKKQKPSPRGSVFVNEQRGVMYLGSADLNGVGEALCERVGCPISCRGGWWGGAYLLPAHTYPSALLFLHFPTPLSFHFHPLKTPGGLGTCCVHLRRVVVEVHARWVVVESRICVAHFGNIAYVRTCAATKSYTSSHRNYICTQMHNDR
jgi:hypothetical protein